MNKRLMFIIPTFIILLAALYGLFNGGLQIVGNSKEDSSRNSKNIDLPAVTAEDIKNINVIVLKLAHSYSEGHPHHIALVNKFVPLVQEGSDWKIIVELYPNNQLLPEKESIQAVQKGTIEMTLSGQALNEVWPQQEQLQKLFLFNSYENYYSNSNEKIREKIDEKIEKIGLHNVAWGTDGFRQVFLKNNNFDERKTIVSIYKDKEPEKIMNLNLNVVEAEEGQIERLLNDNSVDGYESTILTSYYNGWYLKRGQLLLTNHAIAPVQYLVSSKFWKTLPGKYQTLIEKAAKETAKYETELMEHWEEDTVNVFTASGVQVGVIR